MTVAEADAAAARGDITAAAALLEQAVAAEPDNPELWMKLAALQRHLQQPARALQSVNRVLALTELDFMALSFKAMLMEQLAPDAAGEAWANALTQLPPGQLPPHVQSVVQRGIALRDQWTDRRDAKLADAARAAEARADPEEATRIARFRTNISRKTAVYHSEPTDFHFPGLREREFHARADHPWLETLERHADVIAAELQAVMAAERTELVPYIQYEDHAPMAQWRELNRNRDWTAIHLLQNGRRIDANARHCPETMALLATLPQPDVAGAGPNAMFSLLAPHTTIPAHVGVANTRLVCHLPLIVPEGCWFRVGAETRFWKQGQAFVFDDTIEHEAANPSDQLRVVFIFDIWHPDLTEVERDAVRSIIGAETGVGGAL
ncbi:aspartyl/asparaginyl beta-hydroxylase domain-containing protein [Sphingomonas jaspsi]|uniref:aspartyl/asparaginyl beta-hydroxylase domain-containing protein n=1 Tax=Sphingomonas jaspsi TaxID=392409 RepID=UPI0004B9BF06|nr:aspartyl/asparaginyl beta-hydroxylase domain-containing protein [Sphingomonas jaspsi]